MNSLIAVAASAGFMHLAASLPEKDAPTASSATGVAVPPMVLERRGEDARQLHAQQRKRHAQQNAEDDRVFHHVDQRAPDRRRAVSPGGISRLFFIRMRRKLQNQYRVHVENGTAESTIIGTMPALL